jgi:threonine/homoserine/homoserine lactone efflux protein
MWTALGELFPLAIAAAVSTVPITITLLILISDSRSTAAIPFLAGTVLGVAILLSVATLAARGVPVGGPRNPPTALAVLEILVGVALVLYGVVTLRRRAEPDRASERRNRLSAIESLRPGPAFGLGLAMSLRPKALLLVIAAGLALRSQSLGLEATAVGIALYTVLATSTVVAPIVLTLLAPDRMEPRLESTRGWMAKNGPLGTAGVALLVGAFVTAAGVMNLS